LSPPSVQTRYRWSGGQTIADGWLRSHFFCLPDSYSCGGRVAWANANWETVIFDVFPLGTGLPEV
jgi:hypothetical protein